MYCVLLGNCFGVKMTTKEYGEENSWSLGTCSSYETYSENEEYTEDCCLNNGTYILNCKDSHADGWHGGFIEIQGTQYCKNFIVGSLRQQSINVTIATIGKYSFSQN